MVSVLGVCYDVTAQVRAEEAREKAQAMYRLMTEEASDIILMYDRSGGVLFASHALERVLNRTAQEIEYGRSWNSFIPTIARKPQGSQFFPLLAKPMRPVIA